MNKHLIVVARYNENLEWLNDLKYPVLVYNKGKSWPYNFPRKDVENVGREAETYLRFICENYDNLHKFDSIVFLQGNPNDHCKFLVQFINDYHLDYSVLPLCETLGNVKLQAFCSKYIVPLLTEHLINENYNSLNGPNKVAIMMYLMKINLFMLEFQYACGAQYIVPTQNLLDKSFEWWQNVYRVYKNYLKHCKDDPGLLMEFAWPAIWFHKDK